MMEHICRVKYFVNCIFGSCFIFEWYYFTELSILTDVIWQNLARCLHLSNYIYISHFCLGHLCLVCDFIQQWFLHWKFPCTFYSIRELQMAFSLK